MFVFVVHTSLFTVPCWRSHLSHLKGENVRSLIARLGEPFLLDPQQYTTTMAKAKMSAAKIQGFKKGDPVHRRSDQSAIYAG